MIPLYVATEDQLSSAVAVSMIRTVDKKGLFDIQMIKPTGNGQLKSKLSKYINLSYTYPVLMITDLDRISCAPILISQWLGQQRVPDNMLFRVAVRETEAWLLSDSDGFSQYFQIPLLKVPDHPENLDDPKLMLLNLIRRYGLQKDKLEILPPKVSGSKVGIGYNNSLITFVEREWEAERASLRSDSLSKAMGRLQELSDRLQCQP